MNDIDYICILKPNFKITSELITKIEKNKNAHGKIILPRPKFDINNKKQYFNDELWLFSTFHTKTVLEALIESAHATLDQLEEEENPFNLVSNFFKFIDANKIYYTNLDT